MKWTALDIALKLEQHIKTHTINGYTFMQLPNSATGGIYLNQRPAGSDLEDVVVNTGTLSNDIHQEGELTINIYVKNPTLIIKDKENRSLPDTYRLDQLTDMMKPYVQEIWAKAGACWNYELTDTKIKAGDNLFHYAQLVMTFRGIYIES